MKVKDGMQEEYANYAAKNSADDYSKCCVDAGEVFAKSLDEGKTPDQANSDMCDSESGKELTGFMAGCVMQSIVRFHERGDEVKKWWNTRWGGTGEEAGTVNPAIITIETNENEEPSSASNG